MAMTEGSSLAVLTGEPDGGPLEHQRAKGKLFGKAPVDVFTFGKVFLFGIELSLDLRVQAKILWRGGQGFGDFCQVLLGDRSVCDGKVIWNLGNRKRSLEGAGFLDRLYLFEGGVQLSPQLVVNFLTFFLGDNPVLDQLPSQEIGYGRHGLDYLV